MCRYLFLRWKSFTAWLQNANILWAKFHEKCFPQIVHTLGWLQLRYNYVFMLYWYYLVAVAHATNWRETGDRDQLVLRIIPICQTLRLSPAADGGGGEVNITIIIHLEILVLIQSDDQYREQRTENSLHWPSRGHQIKNSKCLIWSQKLEINLIKFHIALKFIKFN